MAAKAVFILDWCKSVRLGDKVERVAKVTGAAAMVHAVELVTGKPCGCGERKAVLNGESVDGKCIKIK